MPSTDWVILSMQTVQEHPMPRDGVLKHGDVTSSGHLPMLKGGAAKLHSAAGSSAEGQVKSMGEHKIKSAFTHLFYMRFLFSLS